MNWELILLLTGIMLFAYWLNYIMGSPLADKPDDVDPKAILFSFPLWLAERRVKYGGSYKNLKSKFYDEINITSDYIVKVGLRSDHRREILLLGRQLFTWERALLCPICLHWWLSLIVGFLLVCADGLNARADFFQACFTYLVLHLIIRKIS